MLAPVLGWLQGSALSTTVTLDARAALGPNPGPGLVPGSTGRADIEIVDPTASERLVAALPGLGGSLTALVVAMLLYRFVADLNRGEPFSKANVRRFRLISLAIAAGAMAVAGANSALGYVIAGRLSDPARLAFTFELPLAWFGAALAVAAIAEAFAIGARLRSDVEGVI
ncbi:DUF2975 domain-containing protein [Sinomonas sp. JGH33]|uniref:DUF2975 domain-containing protein n=1 Tax=Sinomonas terricola TaxID=3110330 RepID=A0ABU5T1V4_9MICC|nr:DUF2975 domain-containing protein [Sinomonas sp. JGH33]MEA5453522.1 DUF2975 domain-containing protein [Sinomonas sp. JGH33]